MYYKLPLVLLFAILFISIEPVDLTEIETLEQEPSEYSPFVTQFAEDYGLSLEEARQTLWLQQQMIEWSKPLRDDLEADYVGPKFEYEPEMHLILYFTSSDGWTQVEPYLVDVPWADRVEVRQVLYSMEDLQNIIREIGGILMEYSLKIGGPDALETNPLQLGGINSAPPDTLHIYTLRVDEVRTLIETHELTREHVKTVNLVYHEGIPTTLDAKPATSSSDMLR